MVWLIAPRFAAYLLLQTGSAAGGGGLTCMYFAVTNLPIMTSLTIGRFSYADRVLADG